MPHITLYEHTRQSLIRTADGKWIPSTDALAINEYGYVTPKDMRARVDYLSSNTLSVKRKKHALVTRAATPLSDITGSDADKCAIAIKEKKNKTVAVWAHSPSTKTVETWTKKKIKLSDTKRNRRAIAKIKDILSMDKDSRQIFACRHFDRTYITIIGYKKNKTEQYELWIAAK